MNAPNTVYRGWLCGKCICLLLLSGCASDPVPVERPAVDRIRCMALGAIPDSKWWAYVCTFEGDSIEPPRPKEPTNA